MKSTRMLALCCGFILCIASAFGAAAGADELSGHYQAAVPLGPVLLNGTFPITVQLANGDGTGTLDLTVDVKGVLKGTLQIAGKSLAVTGKQKGKVATLKVDLGASDGGKKIKLTGTLKGGAIGGKSTSASAALAKSGTFSIDVSSAATLLADFELDLKTDASGSVAGKGTALIGGGTNAVNAKGKANGGSSLDVSGAGLKFS